jgi:DNA polymerase-1
MPPKRKTLCLIDGHALAYRTYFALTGAGSDPNRWVTKSGEPTAGTYGFASVLLKIMEQDRPDYLAVSFDVGRTFRDDLFPDYKGTRAKMPDDLQVQIERINELVAAFNIPILVAEGYEADDVLGTVAQKAAKMGLEVKIVTGDRDLLQLADKHVTINLAGQSLAEAADYGPEEVKAKYGLTPKQYIDFKALVGDKSDNIPGVSGVGEKTAAELLQKYGSLDGIYKHLDEVPARFKNKLEAGKDSAYLSRKLSTIVTDLDIDLDLEACKTGAYDREQVVRLFQVLEFRSLLKRLPEGPPTADRRLPSAVGGQLGLFGAEAAATPVFEGPTKTIIVQEAAALDALVKALNAAPFITFDVETTSTDPMRAELVGIALCVREGEGYYIPVGHGVEDGGQRSEVGNQSDLRPPTSDLQLPVSTVIAALKRPLTNARIPKYGHNVKYDFAVLARLGLRVAPLTFDTMLAEWLCDPASYRLGLKKLAFVRLGVEMEDIDALIGSGKKQITMDRVPVERAARYAAADVDMTTRLVPILRKELEEKGQTRLLTELEMPLVPILAEMEMAGVALDADTLGQMSAELEKQLAKIEKEIYKWVGYEFNINSTQQLAEALFGKLQLKPADKSRKTAAGKYSTAADVLEDMRGQHPVIDLIFEQRELSKLKSTYVDALPQAVNPATGRVHTSYNQAGSVTGRIASSEPNLQNIPIRTELGRRVRKAFVAERGQRLVAADYSQIELRLAAHMSQDAALLQAFRRGEDIHTATAAAVLGLPPEKVNQEQRRTAKCVAAGTLVYTSQGLLPIESLATGMTAREYRPIDLQVLTDRGLQQATHVYFDGHQPVLRIRVHGGLEIACTSDHQLRVIDHGGNYTWRRAADLRPGDFVALLRGAAVYGAAVNLPKVIWPEDMRTTNFRDLDLPTHWTPELARFFGYAISEGYIYHHPTKKYSAGVVLSQHPTERQVADDMRRVCQMLFGQRSRAKKRRGNQFFLLNSSKLVYWLDVLEGSGNSQAKTIPTALLRAPRHIQVEFLRALFAGDGSLKSQGRTLTYCTKSPNLARRLQQMLLNFGFYFRLYQERRTGLPDPYYVLSLGGASHLERFMRDIGIIGNRKTRVRSAMVYDLSIIPGQWERLIELYPLLHGSVREKAYEVLRPAAPVRLNRTRARMIVDQLQAAGVEHPALSHLSELLNLDLNFVQIEEISPAESAVYDLVVPGSHCYVANGFISHNTVNFGILYGQGAYGLMKTTGLTLAEAENFIQNYFERFPGLKRYLDETRRLAAERGYVETLLGRRRYFPGLSQSANTREAAIARARFEREAINAPIQGTAADIIKLAMLRLPEALAKAKLSARMLLQVHDELVFECPTDEVEATARTVRAMMESAFTLDIPLGVEVRSGKNWEEMRPVKP